MVRYQLKAAWEVTIGQLGNMSADAKRNEWNLLLDRFHALAREGSDSIEDIFDHQFRRRFSKLIDKVSGAAWRGWDDREQ